jgi:hypothetical protein
MIHDNVEKVFRSIVARNSLLNSNAIPHSDAFYNEMESLLGISKDEIDVIISMLKESHKIFVIEISKEDKLKKVDKIQGFIDADRYSVQKLKAVFHKLLEGEYENYAGKKKTAHQIIKEMIPRLQYINNSPMGRVLNKAMMLDEYDRLLEREYKEYTEEWKEENLKLQMEINSGVIQDIKAAKEAEVQKKTVPEKKVPGKTVRRAVDSPAHDEFIKQNSITSINKQLQIYGVDFFFRVNLRNYKFDYIKTVLEKGVVERKQDLQVLKGMLLKVKGNISIDRELENYTDEIAALERLVNRLISFSKK